MPEALLFVIAAGCPLYDDVITYSIGPLFTNICFQFFIITVPVTSF